MNTRTLLTLALLLLASIASAQTTAFTYQGHLMDGGASANGSYDIQFTLKTALSGGATVGTAQAVSPVSAVNGIFTVTLDFGSGPFDGSDRWVELAVRPAGSPNPYTVLSPRQKITSTPYAMRSLSAGTATSATNATNLTGTLSGANIPAGTITSTMIAPGTQLPTVAVTGNTLAVANTSYTATAGAAQPVIELPATANVGDVIQITGGGSAGWAVSGGPMVPREGNRNWLSVASSSDGSKLVAVVLGGQIYTSTDSGVSWTARENNREWYSVACSADGSKLVAVEYGGQIYTSTDSGVSWLHRDSDRTWHSVASSADGSKLVAVEYFGQIYTSTDSGVSWTARESSRFWRSVASSADGSKLVAVASSGQIYTSTDSGVSWTPRESSRFWYAVASSADGSKLVAAVLGGQIYTSTDSGVSWTPRESNRSWRSVSSSADGSKLVAVVDGGQIYTSTDSGISWTARESSRFWRSVASSADGSKLVAVVDGGQIYTSLAGTQGSSVALQYQGNGQWSELRSIQEIDLQAQTSAKVNRSGDTMTGDLTVPRLGIGTSPSHPLTLRPTGADLLQFQDSTGANQWHLKLDGTDSGNLNFGESGVAENRLLLEAGGDVGIGTADPTAKLDVNGTAKATAFIGDGSALTALNAAGIGSGSVDNTELGYLDGVTAALQPQLNGKVSKAGDTMSGPLTLQTTSGDASATARLNLIANGGHEWRLQSVTGFDQPIPGSGPTASFQLINTTSTVTALTALQDGKVGLGRIPTANRLEVEGNASKTTAGDWLANSDRRIKEDIQPIGGALETLSKVRLVDFRYTADYRAAHPGIADQRYLNVVAQEFAEVFPEHVKSSGETLPDGSPILQVDTYPLTIYSAAAVQELNAKHDADVKKKDAEIEALKARLERLEKLLPVAGGSDPGSSGKGGAR